jgi:predicted Zn-dependent peptidase
MIPVNRSLAPEVSIPVSVNVPQAVTYRLSNGSSIYVIDAGEDEVVRLEIIIPNSATDSNSFMIASAAHSLADAGTKDKSAEEIAEEFDFFGSFFQNEISPDYRSFTLYSINRFFKESLQVFLNVLLNPTFPETEVENWKRRSLQSLAVNREKVAWLGRKAMIAGLFGPGHPYGFTPEIEDYESVTAESLRHFHQTNNDISNGILIISGKVDQSILDACEQLTALPVQGGKPAGIVDQNTVIWPSLPKSLVVEKNGSVQFGLRMGMRTITKNHPDFQALSIVNTILGGYFGSRLMSNIREDKGYTYGIGSMLTPYLNAGSFTISTEVGRDVCKATAEEIRFELQRLATVPVPDKELEIVRNYLTGTFLRSLDGPFAIADRFKGLVLYGLEYDYLKNYLDLLNNINQDQILDIASRYLNPENMIEIISGS